MQGAGTTSEPGTGYRPHLDGLRAVAVYLVVAFHAGADRFSRRLHRRRRLLRAVGLPRDAASSFATSPRRAAIRLGRFYSPALRRLLPAALVVAARHRGRVLGHRDARRRVALGGRRLPGGVPVRRQLALHPPVDRLLRADRQHATRCCTSGRSRSRSSSTSLWPLLLSGLVLLTPRASVPVRTVCAAGGGRRGDCWRRSLWALHLAGPNLDRAYYGTDTRAYQLLAGALLALTSADPRAASGSDVSAQVAAVAAVAASLASVAADLGGRRPDHARHRGRWS